MYVTCNTNECVGEVNFDCLIASPSANNVCYSNKNIGQPAIFLMVGSTSLWCHHSSCECFFARFWVYDTWKYRIALNFRGSKFLRMANFEDFIEIIIFANLLPTHTPHLPCYGCGIQVWLVYLTRTVPHRRRKQIWSVEAMLHCAKRGGRKCELISLRVAQRQLFSKRVHFCWKYTIKQLIKILASCDMGWYKANAHFHREYYKQRKLGSLLGTTKSVCTILQFSKYFTGCSGRSWSLYM